MVWYFPRIPPRLLAKLNPEHTFPSFSPQIFDTHQPGRPSRYNKMPRIYAVIFW